MTLEKRRILFSEEAVVKRVSGLAEELDAFYCGREVMAVALLNGGTFFACDLVKKMKTPVIFDTASVSSYVHDKRTDDIVIRMDTKNDPAGKNIVIIDDILDSGCTMKLYREHLLERGAREVKTCVFLKKLLPEEIMRKRLVPDWYGFEVENCYVAGYGLDSEELYRNVPYVFSVN